MTKHVLCASCDVHCQVSVETPASGDMKDVKVKAMDPGKFRANICIKGINAPEGFNHKNRILKPLKRVGERGSGQWEEVSWEDAMSDIAERLQKITDKYGPEAFAMSSSPALVQNDYGMGRRFMNVLGSPNYISGVALCMGNTSAVNRMVYGWFPYPDYSQTQCIVLFGHDPKPHSWTSVYNAIRRAQEKGAKLIVVDPRKSENAKLADLWLPLKPGTDAALLFGWLKVILDEELYDHDFVENWTVGFEELKTRAEEFSLDQIADITGVGKDLIQEAARLYATSGPAVIPWTPITDQQRNSTSAIRLHCTLRAICGNLDIPGGEIMHGFHKDIVPESVLERHDLISDTQKQKQLGAKKHPVFTYEAMGRLNDRTKKVWGHEWVNFLTGNYMAHPPSLFRAMSHGDPYPVKAFFAMANNTLLSYANMQAIHDGLMNQELVVAFEQFKTPTAQLADYILPSDSWLERNGLSDGFGWTAIYRTSQKVINPPGECRGAFDFWIDLANRMGMKEHFPWQTEKELLDYRLEATGMDFETFASKHPYHMNRISFRKYEQTGFATPSGKVELYSSMLEDFGFDPLPYWREEPKRDPQYPLTLFIGVREDEYFQTGHRHIGKMRKRNPSPRFFIAPEDAKTAGLEQDDWAFVETNIGKVRAQIDIQEEMPKGVVRVPHGWWDPDLPEGVGTLSGAWEFADAQICPDDDDHTDLEQGIQQLKGIACKIYPVPKSERSGYSLQKEAVS